MTSIEKIETRALLRFWAKYLVRTLNGDDGAPSSIYAVRKTLDRLSILTEKLELDLDKDEQVDFEKPQ